MILTFRFLLFCCLLPLTITAQSVPSVGDIVVNEIMYNAPGASAVEYIEFYNRSNKTFDMAQFRWRDNTTTERTFSASSLLLLPNAYLVITNNLAEFNTLFPGILATQPPSFATLNNSGGDSVVLTYNGNIIEQVNYVDAWGGTDKAIERKDPASGSNLASNWGNTVAILLGTPNAQNSIYAPDLTPPQVLFAEAVGTNEVRLVFSEPLRTSSVNVTAFQGATSAVLSPDGLSVLLNFGAVPSIVHISGIQDFVGNTMPDTQIPIALNPSSGQMIINEILADPLADSRDNLPDQPEFIELFNKTDKALNLTGLYWHNKPNENGAADTVWVPSGNFYLPPNGYAILSAEPDYVIGQALSTAKIVKAFPSFDFSRTTVQVIPIKRSTLSLDNAGDHIRMFSKNHVLLDSLTYAESWHHPNRLDPTGFSLERINPNQATANAQNWTSSFNVAGATPGERNSAYTNTSTANNVGISVSKEIFTPDGDGVDEIAAFSYQLSSSNGLLRARIYDEQGRLVRTLSEALLSAQTGTLFWDGTNDDGERLRIGIYVLLLENVAQSTGLTEVFKKTITLYRK